MTIEQLTSLLQQLFTKNIELHGRRVVTAGSAVDGTDYVTLDDLIKYVNNSVNAIPEQSTNFTTDVSITKLRPSYILKVPAATTKGHVFSPLSDYIAVTINLNYDGSAWIPDDAAKVGYLLIISVTGGFTFYYFPVGGSLTSIARINSAGLNLYITSLMMNGTQVLTTQQADITAAINPGALNTTQTAGATYTANEQTMLAALKADVTALHSAIVALVTIINNQRAVNQAHGLTA